MNDGWQDINGKHILRFWGISNEAGPIEICITNSYPLFFIGRESEFSGLNVRFTRKNVELKNFLGEPKTSKDWETRNQWEFNCQSHQCKNDINKFNLAFNSEKNIFKCWKCKDSGIVHKLVYKYGSQEDNKNLKLIMPTYTGNYVNVFRKNIINHNLITCPLPECYTPITSTIKTAPGLPPFRSLMPPYFTFRSSISS